MFLSLHFTNRDSQRVKTTKPWPRYLTVSNDGNTLCLASHYVTDGLTLMDTSCNETCFIPIHYSLQTKTLGLMNDSVYIAEKDRVCRYALNGDLINMFGTLNSQISCLCVGPNRMVYIGKYNRLANFHGVIVYHHNGEFSKVLSRQVYPVDMAFDSEGNIHICDNRYNKIKVLNTNGKLLQVYGLGHLNNPTRVAVHPDGFCVVLECVSLAVFSKTGQYIYSIDIDQHGIIDFAITGDGALWIIDNYFHVIKQKQTIFYDPPLPLSLLCQSVILVHLAELPVSLLPSRYMSMLTEWSEVVEVEIKPQQTVLKMKVPTSLDGQGLVLLLEERLGYSKEVLSSHMKRETVKYGENKVIKYTVDLEDAHC